MNTLGKQLFFGLLALLSPSAMDKEVLEVVLMNCARNSNVKRVIEVEDVPALAKGENYTSDIKRLRLKVLLGNGRMATRSVFMKQVITKEEMGKLLQKMDVIKAEAKLYSVVLKEMAYLMEEFEDYSDTPWCELIHYDLKSAIIVLEDLKPSGYKVVPRQKGLDLEHATVALEALGRFHAMGKVLEERGVISKREYGKYRPMEDKFLVKTFFYAGIKNTAKVMKESWDPCWKTVSDDLLIPYEKFVPKFNALRKPDDSEFTVLNHGDCWSNNMMFKYDWRDRPISIKFVDFQTPHYHTPCYDVTYVLYFGVQPEVRRQYFDLLVQCYYDSLVRTMDKFGCRWPKPSLGEINAAMDRMSFFGLAFFTCCYASIISNATDPYDLEKLLETDGEEGFNPEPLREPGVAAKMGPDLIEFVQKHLKGLK